MPTPYQRADYYRSHEKGDFRIGSTFAECNLAFGFTSQQLTICNDSIETDIEYSFDGSGVAGMLKHGTDERIGGESYEYVEGEQLRVYLRVKDGDDAEEDPIPFRVFAYRGIGRRST